MKKTQPNTYINIILKKSGRYFTWKFIASKHSYYYYKTKNNTYRFYPIKDQKLNLLFRIQNDRYVFPVLARNYGVYINTIGGICLEPRFS
jgi:hypothetical protein